MKRIRALSDSTPGLAKFRNAVGSNATWARLRSRRWRAERHEVRDALTRNQHGLCAYCEMEITERGRQIEHVIPRSHDEFGDDRALDISNMVACCMGGTVSAVNGEEDETKGHFRDPIVDNVSCGQAKGDRYDADFVDPRTLPASPSLTRVGDDGLMETEENACHAVGFSPDRMDCTLKMLNLNAERLRLAREKWRNDLVQQSRRIDDPDTMNVWIRAVLTPGEDGRLLRFFTTSRSYFAPVSELVLEEHPHTWI